jgi:hypothetical protein
VNGTILQDPKVVAKTFTDYHAIIADSIPNNNLLTKNTENSVNAVKYNSNSMFLTPTTELEVVDTIKGLNNKKSTGVDDISEYVIKKCYPEITILTFIIYLSLSMVTFPNQLKITNVKPLYKKGLDTDVGNYRPVTLISGFFPKNNRKNCPHKTLHHF